MINKLGIAIKHRNGLNSGIDIPVGSLAVESLPLSLESILHLRFLLQYNN